MSDRLAELSRQRALVQEHLTWLEAEIAREQQRGLLPLPHNPPSNKEGAPFPILNPELSVEAPRESASPSPSIDAIVEKYRVPPDAVRQDVRKGCLLYFVGAFVLLGVVVAILYFTVSSR